MYNYIISNVIFFVQLRHFNVRFQRIIAPSSMLCFTCNYSILSAMFVRIITIFDAILNAMFLGIITPFQMLRLGKIVPF